MRAETLMPSTAPAKPPAMESVIGSTRNCERMSRVFAPIGEYLRDLQRLRLNGSRRVSDRRVQLRAQQNREP
jgi:hypothetical protein